jgi:hypothetical protein
MPGAACVCTCLLQKVFTFSCAADTAELSPAVGGKKWTTCMTCLTGKIPVQLIQGGREYRLGFAITVLRQEIAYAASPEFFPRLFSCTAISPRQRTGVPIPSQLFPSPSNGHL